MSLQTAVNRIWVKRASNQAKKSNYCKEIPSQQVTIDRAVSKRWPQQIESRRMALSVKTQMINCGKVAASTRLKFPSSQRSETSCATKFRQSNKRAQLSTIKFLKQTKSFYLRILTRWVMKIKPDKLWTRNCSIIMCKLSAARPCVSTLLLQSAVSVFYVPETACGASDRVKASIKRHGGICTEFHESCTI